MATFNGIQIGSCVRLKTRAARVALQITAYPGVNGLSALDMGSRGYLSYARGLAVAESYAALGVVESFWRAAQQNAVLGTLVDNFGGVWLNVVLVDYDPADDEDTYVVSTAGLAGATGYGREFRMEFLHLS